MTDEQTEALKGFNDEQAKIVAEYVQTSLIEELKNIKEFTEILKDNSKCKGCDKQPYDVFISLCDKRIAELKGE